MIYFDNAATTRVSEKAAAAALAAMREGFANPSAAYRFGIEAGQKLAESRKTLTDMLGVPTQELIFTSCATEGINQAIRGIMAANRQKGARLLYSAVEHPAVAETANALRQFEGISVEVIPVDSFGRVKLDELERLLQEPTVLVCVQLVNNELGTIQPVREVAALTHRYGALLLTDGVQGFGKLDCKMNELQCDAFVLSGHKLHAPKGVGALWLSPAARCRALISGGGQEARRRSGTENMPGIAALAAAAREVNAAREANMRRCREVRDALLQYIEQNITDIRCNSDIENGSPYILSVSFAGTKSEVLLHYLESRDICVSAGSACSTHKNSDAGRNAVLTACGIDEKWTGSCLRFSFSEENTVEEALAAGKVLREAVEEIRLLMR